MPYFQRHDGGQLFYTDEGQGTAPVVLVHGWVCDSHDWSWQFGALERDYRVIAVDNRGHGRSSISTEGYDVRVFAGDLGALLRTLDTGPVVAIGHSLGAVIVSTLAVEQADLVRGVVSIDPAYGFDEHETEAFLRALAAMRATDGLELIPQLLAAYEGSSTPDYLKAWHRRRAVGTPVDVVKETFANIFTGEAPIATRVEAEAYLVGRSCPVLAIHQQARHGVAAWEKGLLTGAFDQVAEIGGTGHWLHQERAGEVNELLLGWIGRLPQISVAA